MLALGGISAVNALGSWYGSSIAVNLKVSVKISECDGCEHGDPLIKEVVNYFRKNYGIPNQRVEISSEIPPKSGLKSSSAVSTALIGEIAERYGLEVNVPALSAILSIKAGVSLTGALDDATASYYGGQSFTYNKELKILKVSNPPEGKAVILMRGFRPKQPRLSEFRKYGAEFRRAFELAYSGKVYEAIRLNGRLVARIMGYEEEILERAERLGALASGVSGNGPSLFAITKEGDEGPIVEEFSKHGEVRIVELVSHGGLGRTFKG